MFQRILHEANGAKLRQAAANVILVATAFIWYLLAFNGLLTLLNQQIATQSQDLLIIGINTGAIVLSGLLGTFVVDKIKNRRLFFYLWLSIGVVVSIVPIAFVINSVANIAIVALIFGLYFGVGMPATMGYHSGFTNIEGRAKIGGVTFLLIGISFAITNFVALNLLELCIILAAIRIIGLIVFRLTDVKEEHEKIIKQQSIMKYRNLIENKAFIFYFIPWLMITLVNFLTIPIQSKIYPSNGNLYETLYAGENVVIALVAVICGFIADKWGRKRLSIIGFVMLGIGYAVIGLSYSNIHDPSDLTGMFYPSIFFAISDGIAWGIFYVLFLFTLWGDLGQGKISDKIYYLGALPYISSYFLRELFAPSLSQLNPLTIFTFASVFLFLAVLPLLYASETLPEKVMKDRDLKSYIEKAKKKADKESKREQRKEETQDAIPDENYEEATKLAEKYY